MDQAATWTTGQAPHPPITDFYMPRRAAADAVEQMQGILEKGCFCKSRSARVVRRKNANGVYTVAIQCSGCGKSLGGNMKRLGHPDWVKYPEWDEGLRQRHIDQWRIDAERREQERHEKVAQRRREYSFWLATSGEWRDRRGEVLKRAKFLCEACLEAPAEHVHHLTYHFGKLPPAWLLRAVCVACHEKLHDETNEWHRASAE